jgi:hypothetical protein
MHATTAPRGIPACCFRFRKTTVSSSIAPCKACDSVASGTKKSCSFAACTTLRTARGGGRCARVESPSTKAADGDRPSRSPNSTEGESATAARHFGQPAGSNPTGMSQRLPHRGHFQSRRVIMPSLESLAGGNANSYPARTKLSLAGVENGSQLRRRCTGSR